MKKTEGLMTTLEAMAYLRISRVTLYRLMKRKELPVRRVGYRYRYRKNELDRWLNTKSMK